MDSLASLLAESDFVSVNVSRIDENKNMFTEEVFSQMKPRSSIINCSYEEAIDLKALANAIKSGHLHGAAIDVFPGKSAECLKDVPNVILSNNICMMNA